MDNYTPNSHKYREENKAVPAERPKMDKVVKGTVKTKKKGEMHKLKDVFISEDAANVKNYLLMDVLLPAVKNLIEDTVTNGIRMILRGETAARRDDGRRSGASRVSYDRLYNNRDDRRGDSRPRVGYTYDDLSFPNRGDAEVVLSRLDEAVEAYGIVSVADMYDLAGVTPNHTDYNYGWTNLRNASVRPTRDGYIIDMPKALPIAGFK
jgi:hypothetical protein